MKGTLSTCQRPLALQVSDCLLVACLAALYRAGCMGLHTCHQLTRTTVLLLRSEMDGPSSTGRLGSPGQHQHACLTPMLEKQHHAHFRGCPPEMR